MKEITLAEAMAICVLKGDRVAAYALAESLIEELHQQGTPIDKGYRALADTSPMVTGFEVYRWPEFREFAKRLGILYNLNTYDIIIELFADDPVVVKQRYMGIDTVINGSTQPTQQGEGNG